MRYRLVSAPSKGRKLLSFSSTVRLGADRPYDFIPIALVVSYNYGTVLGADGQPVIYTISNTLLADFLRTYSAVTAPGCFAPGSGANEFICDIVDADVRLWGGYGNKYDDTIA